MLPAYFAHLDSHWARHLHCSPHDIRANRTLIIAHPHKSGATAWLFDKTCLITAAPHIAAVLQLSVGTRTPMQAFEPGRLRAATADFGLPLTGPESILVCEIAGAHSYSPAWVDPSEDASEVGESLAAAGGGIALMCVSLRARAARRAAETCGFVLYASAIHIGEREMP